MSPPHHQPRVEKGPLPDNLITDILSRLEVKKIINFKLVCKKWRDLISDPYFVRLHLSRSRQEDSLMIHECTIADFFRFRPGTLMWAETTRLENDYDLHLVKSIDVSCCESLNRAQIHLTGSVNGLICCHRQHDYIYVFNPVLGEYILLPKPQSKSKTTKTTIVYGFGVSMTGEYKVIRVCGKSGGAPFLPVPVEEVFNEVDIEVYTLGTDEWRVLDHGDTNRVIKLIKNIDPRVPMNTTLDPGVFLNSHVYWLLGDKVYDFDLTTETFESFPSPPSALEDVKELNRMLGVLKGRLSLVSCCSLGLELWVMKLKEGGDHSWHKEIAMQQVVSPVVESRLMCFLDGVNGNSVLMVIDHDTQQLMGYCLETNTILNLASPAFFSRIMTYCPSFVKLGKLGSEGVHEVYTIEPEEDEEGDEDEEDEEGEEDDEDEEVDNEGSGLKKT